MKVKAKKIASEMAKELSKILVLEVRNEVIKNVTITGCEVTNDLSFAKFFFTYFGDFSKDKVMAELEISKPFLRKKISESVKIRHTPQLLFEYDESIEYGTKIEKLIQKIHQED